MKTSHTILIDLLPGQATTDAIAEHLTQPRPVIEAYLKDLETDGLITPHKIGGGFLTAWRITTTGRQLVEYITQAA
jgi:Mn-dependent DtxR family transcriptional regulator